MLMEKLGPDGGHHCLRKKGTHAIIRTFLSIYYFYFCRSTCSLMGEKVDVNFNWFDEGEIFVWVVSTFLFYLMV